MNNALEDKPIKSFSIENIALIPNVCTGFTQHTVHLLCVGHVCCREVFLSNHVSYPGKVGWFKNTIGKSLNCPLSFFVFFSVTSLMMNELYRGWCTTG